MVTTVMRFLAAQMHMYSASQVFSDANAPTVKALEQTLGQDCHRLQPDMTMKLSPQYPLMAFGGVVTKVSGTSPHQVLPTPLIPVPLTSRTRVPIAPMGVRYRYVFRLRPL